MSIRVALWGPAPNRHVEPLLDAFERRGELDSVNYGGRRLGWDQLGGEPAPRPGQRTFEPRHLHRDVRAAIRSGPAFHLMVSFANRLCFEAMAACARERVPYFVLAESFTPRRSLRGVVRNTVYRYLLRNVTGVFALSPGCVQDFRRVGVPHERIYAGMYPGPVAPLPYAGGNPARVVFIGRFVRLKGLDLLINAASEFRRSGRSIRIELVGAGPERESARAAAAKAGVDLVEHGAVGAERVREILRGSGALVLPTRFREGWGYVVNEAVAAGVPVVTSDIVASRELVVDGHNGAVFRSEDVAALVSALERALALHAHPTSLKRCIDVMQMGLSPATVAAYMATAMEGCNSGQYPPASVPWHAAAERLGGNPETRWWSEWDAERVRLRTEKIPVLAQGEDPIA